MGKKAENLAHVINDTRYAAFVWHFNGDRDYFECHEVMEELWLEDGRHPLLQGLLQAAVGLYHWDNGNYTGAPKLMEAALAKLNPFEETVLGLNLTRLREDLNASLKSLAQRPTDAPFRAFPLVVEDDKLATAAAAYGLSTE